MGRSLVRAAISHGDKVTAVGWSQVDDDAELQKWQDDDSIGLLCEVRVRETIEAVVKRSVKHWGHIDVVAK